jgi:Transposase DDE domain
VNVNGIEELVTDKGYHSGAVVQRVKNYEVRSYIPEKQQKGRRNWQGKAEEQRAVYANRRRVRSSYGKSLLRRRGEMVERSFAHCYETGGMRRCHLRGRENILKRQLIHVGAFNLSLVMRKLLGAGTPRELRNRFGMLVVRILLLLWQGMVKTNLVETVSPRRLRNMSYHRAPASADRHAENQLVAPRAVREPLSNPAVFRLRKRNGVLRERGLCFAPRN